MINFFKGFFHRGGFYFLLSSLFNKGVSILIPVLMVRLVPLDEFGRFEFARSIVFLLTPFFCLGLHEALLKYGSIVEKEERDQIFSSLLIPSLIFSTIIVFVFNAVIEFSFLDNENKYLKILSLFILTNGMFLYFSNYIRSSHDNIKYSIFNTANGFLIFLIFSIFYFLKIKGFVAWAFVVAPIITILIFYRNFPLRNVSIENGKIKKSVFIKYGLYVGVGGIASQLALTLDIIMIGVILNNDKTVGLYKLITIIPSLILFSSSILLKNDFSHLAKEGITNVKGYLVSFWKGLIIPYVVANLIIIFNVDLLFEVLFDVPIVEEAKVTLYVLLIGCSFSFFVRIPVGNILNAIGYAKFNVINAALALIINITLNILFLEEYGILGAALATVLSIFLTATLQIFKLNKIMKWNSL